MSLMDGDFDLTPIEDNIELSPEAQKMFDEMSATFDDPTLIDRIEGEADDE